MSLVKIAPPPGILRRGTIYETTGRYYYASLCRWFAGTFGPIGGWIARTTNAMTGKGRAILAWGANDRTRFIAVGTHSHLYATTASDDEMHDITPVGFTAGRASAVAGGGYGSGLYGVSTYGTARADVLDIQEASQFCLDTFGELLLACMSDDGKLYEWGLDVNAAATVVTNAPINNAGVVVTPERFVVLFGADGDSRKLQWSDQEDRNAWSITLTNQAGDINLATQGACLAGRRLRSSTLIWTELDVHQMTYIGPPFVYRIERLGENCGAISRGAMAVLDTRAVWMSTNSFKLYDGYVQDVGCEVYEDVFNDMNRTQASKVTAVLLSEFSEVWFKYCSAGATEIDRAVVWNYQEDHWNIHDLSDLDASRLCGTDAGVFQNPIMVGDDGYLYDHELGTNYDDAVPSFETGPMEIGNGDRITRARRLIFDESTPGKVSLTVYSSDWPSDAETTHGPYTNDNPVPCRIAGRKLRVKGEFTSPSASDRWGTLRADVMEGSMR